MPVLSFTDYLAGRDLTFGLRPGLLEDIGSRTRRGVGMRELLDDHTLAAAGAGVQHLLSIRRALRRYLALESDAAALTGRVVDAPDAAGLRWAARVAASGAEQEKLAACFAGAVRVTLERGRLRFHLTTPDDPRSAELGALAEHSQGCSEISAQRWFTAARAHSAGLLWIEVVAPKEEIANCLAPAGRRDLLAGLRRAIEGPLLSEIGARAESEAISAAADALRTLLMRPPVAGSVCGLAVDAKRIYACLLDPENDAEHAEFAASDPAGATAWLRAREPALTGLARLAGCRETNRLLGSLSEAGLAVEPARPAGLMKQARRRSGAINRQAARVVAERLADPLTGYADLEPDQLGLGEYLDRVDPARLRGALADVRDAVAWERQSGKTSRPAARGMQISPIVKSVADLKPGMELSGVIANLASFGAFVELGLESQGLVHLSELSDEFVANPAEVVAVGQAVKVKVIEVDPARGRISLSLRLGRRSAGKKGRDRRSAALRDLDKLFS